MSRTRKNFETYKVKDPGSVSISLNDEFNSKSGYTTLQRIGRQNRDIKGKNATLAFHQNEFSVDQKNVNFQKSYGDVKRLIMYKEYDECLMVGVNDGPNNQNKWLPLKFGSRQQAELACQSFEKRVRDYNQAHPPANPVLRQPEYGNSLSPNNVVRPPQVSVTPPSPDYRPNNFNPQSIYDDHSTSISRPNSDNPISPAVMQALVDLPNRDSHDDHLTETVEKPAFQQNQMRPNTMTPAPDITVNHHNPIVHTEPVKSLKSKSLITDSISCFEEDYAQETYRQPPHYSMPSRNSHNNWKNNSKHSEGPVFEKKYNLEYDHGTKTLRESKNGRIEVYCAQFKSIYSPITDDMDYDDQDDGVGRNGHYLEGNAGSRNGLMTNSQF